MGFIARAGDSHHPFQDKGAVAEWLWWVKKYKPEQIILGGDDLDFYHCSQFLKAQMGFGVKYEIASTHRYLADLRKAAPAARIYYLEGNHEERLTKIVLRKLAVLSELAELTVPSLLKLDELEIEWVPASQDLRLEGILHRHGEWVSTLAGRTALKHIEKYGESVAVGHCHRLAVVYRRVGMDQQTGVECGCLCSDEAGTGYIHRPDWCRGWASFTDGEAEVYKHG